MTRVLIADDDHVVSSLLKLELGQKGFEVSTAYDGHQALQILKNINTLPDIVLLDINMPEMSGFDVLTEMKSKPHTKDIPVIMITTRKALEDLSDSVKKGIIDYITKPFSIDTVVSRLLTAHCKKRKGTTELDRKRISDKVLECDKAPQYEITNAKNKVHYVIDVANDEHSNNNQAKEDESYKMLIIEDHQANKTSMMVPFVRQGFDVQVISKEEYQRVKKQIDLHVQNADYDVIIVDFNVEKEESYRLCNHFRALAKDNEEEQVIIGLGEDDRLKHKSEWLEAGINNYFQKPVPTRMVVDCVMGYLNKRII